MGLRRTGRFGLLILFAVPLFGQQPAIPDKCVLAGTAVDAITGAPLSKVEVIAQHLGGREPGASTTTDGKGNFRIVDVDPGQYHIFARRNGYLGTYYGARKSSREVTTIALTAGQTLGNLQIKMIPFGVIAGTVRDSDGDPVTHVMVELSTAKLSNAQRSVDGYDSAETNDLGEFRFADLPAGLFYLSVKPSKLDGIRGVDHSPKSDAPREYPIFTFYPDASDPGAAVPIDLDAGAHFTNANITVRTGALYTITAHVESPPGTKTQAALKYSAADLYTDAYGSGDKEGVVKIAGVPSGSYILQVDATQNKPFDGTVELYTDEGSCSRLFVPVVVDRGNIEGLRIDLKGCATVTGHVILDEQKAAQKIGNLRFVSIDPDAKGSSVVVKNDGTFRIEVSSGHHSIGLSGMASQHLYVRSIRLGNQDILREGFSASPSEQVDIEVVLASDGGTVSGTVNSPGDKPAGGSTVVLIPNDPALRSRRDFTWNTIADQTGHFEFKGVAPGEYKAFAWDDIEDNGWFDPEVLRNVEGKGVSVNVRATEASPAVTLRVIP